VLFRLAQIAAEVSTFRESRMGRWLLVAAMLAALAVAQSVVVTVRPRFFFVLVSSVAARLALINARRDPIFEPTVPCLLCRRCSDALPSLARPGPEFFLFLFASLTALFSWQAPVFPAACPTAISCSVLVNVATGPLQSVYADITVSNGALIPTLPNMMLDPCSTTLLFPGAMASFNGVWNSSRLRGFWNGQNNEPSATSPPLQQFLQLVLLGNGQQSATGNLQFVPVSGSVFVAPFSCAAPQSTTTPAPTQPPVQQIDFVVRELPVNAACPTVSRCLVTVTSNLPLVSVFATLAIANGTLVPTSPSFVSDPCGTSLQLTPTAPSEMFFTGTYNATTLDGGWSQFLNVPVPAGTVTLLQTAVSGAFGTQAVSGFIGVTVTSQLDPASYTFCCGPGCAVQTTSPPTTASTTTAPTTTVPATTTTPVPTLPPQGCLVPFLPYAPVSPLGCPSLVSCTFFVNNSCTPLISAFARLQVDNGALVPGSVNFAVNACQTYVSLPNLTIEFRGSWTGTTIDGEWGAPLNSQSTTAPPPLGILNVVMSGTGQQTVRGTIGVTNPAAVFYTQEVCCGAGCAPVSTTTLPATTTVPVTTTTARTTIPSTTTPTAPPGPCPNATDDAYSILVNSILVQTVTSNDVGCNGAIRPTPGTTTVTLVSGPTSGTLVLQSNGDFTFTPVFNSLSAVSFVYQLCDVVRPSSCSDATVRITVNPAAGGPIARDDTYVLTPATGFATTGVVILNDTSSSSNPAGPNQTPIPGFFTVTAPLSCVSTAVGACSFGSLGVSGAGSFGFSMQTPNTGCPGNYSAVERCLQTQVLSGCRPTCTLTYGYRLTETAGTAQSSSANIIFNLVPPAAHVEVSVTAVTPGPYVVGGNVTFVVRLANFGPETATNVVVYLTTSSGLPVLSSSVALVNWTVASLTVGSTFSAVLSTRIQPSSESYVVTALIVSLTEFDYSVAGHFAVAQIVPVPPGPPIAPNQTFSVTNTSCSSLNVLAAVSGATGALDRSTFAVTAYSTTRGSLLILDDLSVQFTPQQGFVGRTCFGYRICNVFGNCSEGKVFVQVLPSTDAPLQVNLFFG
jgi:uncharacterized repeat protein (TIGR01451 family)